nr:retrovirus-related Pol polyprotein from transposon TNT 1-94 [Tanacetum cinerariifolium]
MNPWGGNAVGYGEAQNRVGNVNQGQARPGQARTVKCYNYNGTGHIARNCTQPKQPQNSEYFKDKLLLMQAQENRVALDAKQLLFLAGGPDNAFDDDVDEQPVQDLALNVDNVFQAEDCDAFDSDVDEAPTTQTLFMANLSSADPNTDEARPSYDSDILSEVQDQDQYLDDTYAYQEEHVMHDSVQLDHVVDLHADHTSVSNMIPYDQYVKDNDVSVIHSNASSVPNDTVMMIYNDMEQVELYERRAKFELTECEQKINEQLRLVISDRNFKEETLKRELHSIKLQLTSTINRNKSIVEETTFLKQDFKQKENKLLADFLNMKSLKEKVEDRLVKQDQSLQTVHMLCRPRPLYNDLNKVAIGYKNPLCLTRAKQAQPALYNGYEILKENHARAKVHNTEDTLEISEITRKKINAKMTDPECVTHKVKIAPHDYSKENLLATFTPQKQLTPEQTYWSNDLMKLKSEALKEWAKNDRFRAENDKVKHHYKQLYDSIKITLAKHIEQVTKIIVENVTLKTSVSQAKDSNKNKHVTQKIQKTNVPVPQSTGVKRCPKASGLQPKSNHKTNRISPAKGANKLPVEDLPRMNKCHLRTMNRVDSSSRLKRTVVQIVLWYLDSGCSKHMTGDRSQLLNFVKKFIGTARLRNDHFGAIMGFGDYVVGESIISRVYYVEGLGHNLFYVGQLCDYNLEVAFRKHSCYVRDTDGVDLIKGSRGSNLYTISVEDMMKSSPICLLSKASKNKSWLWHRCLNHLNFGTINYLSRKDLVRGLPRLKFEKDHLCSARQLGKSKKHTYKPKAKNTNLEVLNTLHMDLCGPMCVQTINGKKCILVIMDDYSRFT